MFGASCAVLCVITAVFVLTARVPRYEQVRDARRSSESVLLDRNNVVIERLRLDLKQRMLEWIPLDAMSPVLLRAVVVSEDQRFWHHIGVDPLGVASALVDNIHRSRARGASTISMQLASLIDPSTKSGAHSWRGKLRQMRNAMAIELHWSKREILEAYLNMVPFRGELVGIDAAARGLLATGPGGLNSADAAVLAVLIRGPGASRQNIGRRACATLRSMQMASTCERAQFTARNLPRKGYAMPGVNDAPHLARRLLRVPGEQLRVTIDADLQRFASETLRTHLAELAGRRVEDGAVVVLDNQSGEVLAYVGSSGKFSSASEVDGVAAERQPGSTLKPFLFGLAMDQRWLTASSVLDDSPLALSTPSGLYTPQDYDRHFRGAVSVRTALGSSLNVPAVRALTMVGVDRFLGTLRDLGLSSMSRDADHYGFGLALGGAETNLLELSNAYRVLANGGKWTPVRFTDGQARDAGRQVLSAQASFIVGDILSDPSARAVTFGLSSALSTRSWAAVKTGTSKGMRDNWTIGYTNRYTVGVWVGNFSGEPMWDVSGITGAAPVWRDIVEHLHEQTGGGAPVPPAGVQRQDVVFKPAFEAARSDWVIADGVRPADASVTRELVAARAQLIAPPNGAVIAPDPDIPERRQSLLLQASSAARTCLRLDGKPVARCGQNMVLLALPQAGRHVLTLTDPAGKTLDTHVFDVRALGMRSATVVSK
ncbi:penicillin-binding protein 1C [Massilia glaciei]|uniref:peptidoglycan glycosyltransferase n=1 Tax=Massilia glaciei TaxID=1524097 RepID=A0A2U2HIS4_9BURK|nr:penicillin-binding protein 1C [Massilia glaciei]PWF46716.1 penicillin-binding protein 1C [Massilia glaciei]